MSVGKTNGAYIKSADTIDSEASDSMQNQPEGAERAAWGGKLEFILTCVGYAVGLGNVWRFPYLCYKNGGGAFLIPYVLMLALVGLPLFYMELSIGQFASLGPLAVWKFNPLFKGLGYASVMVSLLISIYYNVIIAICLYFLVLSMNSEVPWAKCGNSWNTELCLSLNDQNSSNITNITASKTPSEEFFYRYVLEITEGMDDAGGFRWQIALCLLFAWTVTALVLIKGISSLGKVVYFTALFPYVLLTVLVINGATLDGSLEGVRYYVTPVWSRLGDAQVWSDAAVQIFYSIGVASGGLMAMASYNKFNNNCLRDSLIVPVINCLTSFYAGFVIFSVLGYMAKKKNVSVGDVADEGPGLTFVVYPEALATLPLPPLWSILFFFMMTILGFSSEFSMMECVLTAFLDEFPQYLKPTRKREILFRLSACFFCFLCGLPMVTNGGFYLLNLMDKRVGGYPLIIVGIGELIAINWIYGIKRFNQDIMMMLGRPAPLYFKILWTVVSPALMLGVLVFTVIQQSPLEFQGYTYTGVYSALGWLMVAFSIMFIPLVALIVFCRAGGSKILVKTIRPSSSWGPASREDRIGTIYERRDESGTSLDEMNKDLPPDYDAAKGLSGSDDVSKL